MSPPTQTQTGLLVRFRFTWQSAGEAIPFSLCGTDLPVLAGDAWSSLSGGNTLAGAAAPAPANPRAAAAAAAEARFAQMQQQGGGGA